MERSARRGTIRDLADRLSAATAARHPEKWQHDPDPVRRSIVEAMSSHGWAADGIPGVLPFIYQELEAGRLIAYSAFNDMLCTDVELVRTNPHQWYLTEDGEEHILRSLAPPAPTPATQSPAMVSSSAQVLAEKQRRNILDEAIDTAIEKAGVSDAAAIWGQLKALALVEAQPFSGTIRKEDGALQYTNTASKTAWLTRKAFGDRLRRRVSAR